VNTTLPADNDTLDIVTGRGNTTPNSITVGSVTAAGLSNLLGQIRTFATTGNTYIGANPGSATDAGYKLDVNGSVRSTGAFYGTQLFTGAHSFRDQMYITATTDGWTKQNAYNAASAFAMGFVGDLRFAPSAAVKAVFSFNGSYSNNGTIYSGDSSLVKIFTGDAMGNTIGATTFNGYGINLMPTLNYTTGTSNFTGIYYNPTLTATTGLTHYAMNLVAGLVRMGTLAGTGSRMVVTDANGLLSAQAIPDLSGYVTLSTTQTITGAKTFNNLTTFNQNIVGGIIKLSQGVLLSKSAAVGTDAGFLSLIATSATGLNYINIADGDAPSNTQRFAIPNTGTYTYTLPGASGTLALTSDIPSLSNYVTLDGTQTITGLKTFSGLLTANGNIKATYYGFADSNGYSTGFESQSNNTIQVKIGSGLAINIASNNNTTFYGNIIRNGGTSSQFLKADGSLDSSTYLTSASVSGVYLPLSGGTLTGGLNGTSASFSSNFYVSGGTNTNVGNGIHAYYESNYAQIQLNGESAAGSLIDFSTSGTDYKGRIVYRNATNQFEFNTNGNGTPVLTLASGGAATFSSTVEMAGLAVTGVSNKDVQLQSTTNRGWITPYDDGLWLSINRKTTDGSFANTSASAASIWLNGASGGSSIEFRTAGANNTAPTTKLTIDKSGTAIFSSSVIGDVYLIGQVPTYGTANAQFSHKDRSGAGEYSFLSASDGTTYVNAKTGTDINFRINNSNIAIMKPNGNVGINTTNPGERFEVNGSIKAVGRTVLGTQTGGLTMSYESGIGYIESWNSSPIVTAAYNYIAWSTTGSERMRLTSDGRFYIGATSGSERFVVYSNVNSSSSAKFQTDCSTGESFGPIILAGTNSSDYSLRIFNQSGTAALLYVRGDGHIDIPSGGIKTASPTGGTAQTWKFGEATNTLYTATRTVKVEINGALYYLLAVASSDL
jgi:hypothetical protein